MKQQVEIRQKHDLRKKELNEVVANIFKRCIYVIQEINSSNRLSAAPVEEYNYVLINNSSDTSYS